MDFKVCLVVVLFYLQLEYSDVYFLKLQLSSAIGCYFIALQTEESAS